jgi:ubiquinone/menaquinone biosynthesis C-methylase UbiE
MVEAAERGAKARGLTNVESRVMDAQRIELPDNSVDGVLCRFGLMLMPEPALVLSGVRRVLRAGGRLAYAVFGPPEQNPWITLLVRAVQERGHQLRGDPFGPGGLFFSLADAAESIRAALKPMLATFQAGTGYEIPSLVVVVGAQ